MDTRFSPYLYGFEPGKAKIIRTTGALFNPETLRNLLICIYSLEVRNIAVIGHTNCGGRMNEDQMNQLVKNIADRNEMTTKEVLTSANVQSPSELFLGFSDTIQQILLTTKTIREHPLILNTVTVQPFLFDTKKGIIESLDEKL
jgi:carbonic anhydrase